MTTTDPDRPRKILAGGRVRKLRNELGLSQNAMARELGISPSYLNLVERNERALSAQLLIKFSDIFNVDPRLFAEMKGQRAAVEIDEVLADAVFQETKIPKSEIRALIDNAPTVAESFLLLYRAFLELRDLQSKYAKAFSENERDTQVSENLRDDPVEKVRNFIEYSNNYFDPLELKAESILSELNGSSLYDALLRRLQDHRITVEIVPIDKMQQVFRHFDRHRRRLMLSETLDPSGRVFQMAFQLGLIEAGELIDDISQKVGPIGSEVFKLSRITMCNYFAASLMMPYEKFATAAEAVRYDLDVLCARFSASFEQVAHRLTTLARPTRRGVPFFMIRVDTAGNVSKRFSSGSFPFARFGGTCARWNIHSAFRNPGHVESQILEMPDGSKWFSVSRMVQRRVAWGDNEVQFAIALGCEVKYSHRLVYGSNIQQESRKTTPIGTNCRLCERPDCAQRSAPPLTRRFTFNENTRGGSPYSILT